MESMESTKNIDPDKIQRLDAAMADHRDKITLIQKQCEGLLLENDAAFGRKVIQILEAKNDTPNTALGNPPPTKKRAVDDDNDPMSDNLAPLQDCGANESVNKPVDTPPGSPTAKAPVAPHTATLRDIEQIPGVLGNKMY